MASVIGAGQHVNILNLASAVTAELPERRAGDRLRLIVEATGERLLMQIAPPQAQQKPDAGNRRRQRSEPARQANIALVEPGTGPRRRGACGGGRP